MPTQSRNGRSIIGTNIRIFREQSGWSIAELCEPMGWSRAYWFDLERGLKTASLQRLHDIARVLSKALGRSITVRDFLTDRKSLKAELALKK